MNMGSLSRELGKVYTLLSRTGMSQLQHTAVGVNGESIQLPSFPKRASKFKRYDILYIPLYFPAPFIALRRTSFDFRCKRKHLTVPPSTPPLPNIPNLVVESLCFGEIYMFFFL